MTTKPTRKSGDPHVGEVNEIPIPTPQSQRRGDITKLNLCGILHSKERVPCTAHSSNIFSPERRSRPSPCIRRTGHAARIGFVCVRDGATVIVVEQRRSRKPSLAFFGYVVSDAPNRVVSLSHHTS